ncbi:MAG: aryl-sulfate sulfotransferase [Promethearchaeota archaeon]
MKNIKWINRNWIGFLFICQLLLCFFFSLNYIIRENKDRPLKVVSQKYTNQEELLSTLNDNQFILDHNTMLKSESDFTGFINVTKSGKYFDGYNIFGITPTRINYSDPDLMLKRKLIITDMEGKIINRAPLGVIFDLYNSTTLLVKDKVDPGLLEFGSMFMWNFISNKTREIGPCGHHEIEYNPNNHSYFTFIAYKEDINGTTYEFDRIIEFNFAREEIWSVDTQSFISHTQRCPYCSFGESITHSNSIFYDPDEDVIYVNMRNINTFYKINHKTKRILWGLGEYGNFTLFDINGNQKDNLFYHAHAVEKINENTFILFDNDWHNKSDPFNERSRIVEITIDTTTMIASESWIRIFPYDYFSPVVGDADRLPNGNRFATFGNLLWQDPNPDEAAYGARLTEVNETGNIVWEMNFPVNDYKIAVYRAERICFAPIISNSKDIEAKSTEKINVSWKTWYNFRTNQKMVGFFSIFLDGDKIDNGSLYFKKYWYPITINCSLGQLENGNHTLTLSVVDEGGHITYDNINISIKDFILNNTSTTMGKTNIFAIIFFIFGFLFFLLIKKR